MCNLSGDIPFIIHIIFFFFRWLIKHMRLATNRCLAPAPNMWRISSGSQWWERSLTSSWVLCSAHEPGWVSLQSWHMRAAPTSSRGRSCAARHVTTWWWVDILFASIYWDVGCWRKIVWSSFLDDVFLHSFVMIQCEHVYIYIYTYIYIYIWCWVKPTWIVCWKASKPDI